MEFRTTFVDPFNFDEVENAIQDNTKAVFIETLGNPNSDVVDIEKIAEDRTCTQDSAYS